MAMGGAAALAACSSGSETATGPTLVKCQVGLSTLTASIGAGGGNTTVTVTTSPERTWDVSTGVSWLSDLSPKSGQGTGTLQLRVAPNPLPTARDGDIVVSDNRLHVSQAAGSGCQFGLQPASIVIEADGGSRDVTVSAGSDCEWTLVTDAPWIAFTSPVSARGNGRVGLRIAANTGSDSRVGTIALADQRLTVTQSAPGGACSYQVDLTADAAIAASGGTATAGVATTAECTWTASSDAGWTTVASGGSSTGSGTAVFNVATNSGGLRTATITVAGRTFTLTQAAATTPCGFAISPSSASVAASGGTGSTTVTTSAACAWTAASNDPWITVTAGASGAGTGPVTFSVAANVGPARSGTLVVAGQTFTVSQAAAPAPCAYSIAPTTAAMTASGGPGSVAVSTAGGCAWTATSNAAWIAITSGASGAGAGSVAFSVAANTGGARTGTLAVAGQTFTVTQAAAPTPCVFSIAPASTSMAAAGGTGSVAVSTTAGCAWTATSNVVWITVTSGAIGTGNGPVGFSVAANTGGARTGTLTVAGQTFTVTQAAPVTCTYTIAPEDVSMPALGGRGTIAVTTAAGCAWTATSNDSWITVTAGASGSGSGTADYLVAANLGNARTGRLTVAGRTFTVRQARLLGPGAVAGSPRPGH